RRRSTAATHRPGPADRIRPSRRTARNRGADGSAGAPGPGPPSRPAALRTLPCVSSAPAVHSRTVLPSHPYRIDPILGQGLRYENATSVPERTCLGSDAWPGRHAKRMEEYEKGRPPRGDQPLCCQPGSEAQRSAHGEGPGFLVDGLGAPPRDLELVEFGDQLEVAVDVLEQRDAAGLVVGGGAQAVAVVLGLAVGQRDAVLAEAVGALQQVAIAVHLAQQGFAGVVGEERVDALGLEARGGQREAAHLRLHAVAEALGCDILDAAVGVVRVLLHGVDPGIELGAA